MTGHKNPVWIWKLLASQQTITAKPCESYHLLTCKSLVLWSCSLLGCEKSRSRFTKHGRFTWKSCLTLSSEHSFFFFFFNPFCREIKHWLCLGYLKYLDQKRQRYKLHRYFKKHWYLGWNSPQCWCWYRHKDTPQCHARQPQSPFTCLYLFTLLGTNYQQFLLQMALSFLNLIPVYHFFFWHDWGVSNKLFNKVNKYKLQLKKRWSKPIS